MVSFSTLKSKKNNSKVFESKKLKRLYQQGFKHVTLLNRVEIRWKEENQKNELNPFLYRMESVESTEPIVIDSEEENEMMEKMEGNDEGVGNDEGKEGVTDELATEVADEEDVIESDEEGTDESDDGTEEELVEDEVEEVEEEPVEVVEVVEEVGEEKPENEDDGIQISDGIKVESYLKQIKRYFNKYKIKKKIRQTYPPIERSCPPLSPSFIDLLRMYGKDVIKKNMDFDEKKRFKKGSKQEKDIIDLLTYRLHPTFNEMLHKSLQPQFEDRLKEELQTIEKPLDSSISGKPCSRCKGTSTISYQLQDRRADEPMSEYLKCMTCGFTRRTNN